MNRPTDKLYALLKLFLVALLAASAAVAQEAAVATAEVLGIAETRPRSPEASGALEDDSVGEVIVRVRALDASGAPVAGAPVVWTLTNRTSGAAYVVALSAEHDLPILVFGSFETTVDGGVTDENGEAYLVLDARTAGDVSMVVHVGEQEAATDDGSDMRIVWF